MPYLKNLNNAGPIIGIASLIVMILTANHVNIDSDRIMNTVRAVLFNFGYLRYFK